MYITTLTSPFLLRQYIVADTSLKALVRDNFFPINADDGTKGNFVTITAVDYSKEDTKIANVNEERTVEVEVCSKEYNDVIKMLDALRKVVIRMTNAGHDVNIDNAREYKYSFVEGGATWNAELVTIKLRNIGVEVQID